MTPLEIHMQPTHQIVEQFSWAALGVDLIAGYLPFFTLFFLLYDWIEPAKKQEEG